MEREKIENIIWIFCIVVLLLLSVKVDRGREIYSCNQCTVTLHNKLPAGEYEEFGTFKVSELFREYMDGNCKIKWDPNTGYYQHGQLKQNP